MPFFRQKQSPLLKPVQQNSKSKNIPISTISEAIGHDTRIYLASLDTTQVGKANIIILKAL